MEKKSKDIRFKLLAMIGLLFGSQVLAATTDLSSVPLSTSSTTVVRPNILFTLDDSGSMAWNYLPDYAGGGGSGSGTPNHCKSTKTCSDGETPFQAYAYNGLAYNPSISYKPPVTSAGVVMASQTSANTAAWTAVKVDGYGIQSTSTINLVTGYPEMLYCSSGGVCKKNGVDTNNPFLLRTSVADNPPIYALPGSITTPLSIASTPQDGLMNKPTTATSTIVNATLGLSTPSVTANLTGVSVSNSGTTVTVGYNTVSPALAAGDTVVVSGGSCGSGFKSGGNARPITIVDGSHFTYVSNSGTSWTSVTCTVSYTKAAYNAPAPSIIKSGNTVTVTLAAAPVPALTTGNLVTISNGTGACDNGYKTASVAMTRISNTSFSYTNATAIGNANNTTCNIAQTYTANPSSPGIALSGSTVTVYLTNHGLSTGSQIQVFNGTTGTCDSGYRTNSVVSVTKIDTNTFTYSSPVGTATLNSNCKIDVMIGGATTSYSTATSTNANPYYFIVIPTEYCSDIYMTNCKATTSPVTLSGVAYNVPASVRYCKDDATAALPPGDVGAQKSTSGTINCQAKYSVGTNVNFQSARYGAFVRGDIVPTRTTYGNETYAGSINGTGWAAALSYGAFPVVDRSGRGDCASVPNCTYAEEMTNFANWYAYYHTRIQMMKTAAGRSFATVDNRYRVGFVTINPTATSYLPVAMFDATQKSNWYSKLYAISPNNSTPLREALANAGRYFAGKKPWSFATDDPMEYSCQQNYVLITTDGYWNGTDANVKELDGTTMMRNYDNVDSGTSKRMDGAYDGNISGATDTLADVAMYYYSKDIRNSSLNNCTGTLGVDVCVDDVPRSIKDNQAGLTGTQHMTTFSLGLADGLMTYQPDYETAVTGDVSNIKTGATGCSFSGAGTCNWPLPAANSQTALDDLWHAAVNGRGTYYNARDPASLSAGLSGALSGISVHIGAAAAAATSSPIITQQDRTVFSSTYRTAKWDGEIVARLIDPATGNVLPTVIWSAQTQLDTFIHADTSASKTSRHIYTFDDTNALGNHRKEFLYTNLTAAEKAFFDNKCTSVTLLSQCSSASLTSADIASGNGGANLVNWIRGNQSLEVTNAPASSLPVYRPREHVLGDTVNSTPNYVRAPKYSFTDAVTPSYLSFQTAQASRQSTLYLGANDGMLHNFNASTGAEMWGYTPKIVMPNLYKLTEDSYATLHQYYVDGTPETMDIYVNSATYPTSGMTTGWHTIIVGGLGGGGRGFYAMDVTDPANPILMWEICSDSTLCAISDTDIGYSYGNQVIAKRSTNGKWVVMFTSGYNNVSPGTGAGFLFVVDAVSGAILQKISTGSGSVTAPSGIAKIAAWRDSLVTDNTVRYVYGGDLNGDLWRFDLGAVGSAAAPSADKIASLKDSAGAVQSITSKPELGDPTNATFNALSGVGNPVIYVGTGRYLGTTDLTNTQIQTIYAIKDALSKTGVNAYIGNPRTPQTGFPSFVAQYLYQPTSITRSTSQNAVDWSTHTGWYIDLSVMNAGTTTPTSPSPSPGERIRLEPHLVSGTISFISTVPTGSICSAGGSSWKYSFDFMTGKNLVNKDAGILLNEGAEGSVVISVAGQIKELITLTGGETTTQETPTKGVSATRRNGWREIYKH